MRKYFETNKKSIFCLLIGLVVILVSSLCGSLIQSNGGSVKVTDLRDATNTGETSQKITYSQGDDTIEGEIKVTVKGEVKSGLLFVPNSASETNKLPGVVLTHGYLNNRELQLPFAIELARRGFVVLAIDREGHGNYENSGNTNAMMATNGMYQSVKYLYNLPYVDQDKIGISGHSMGGYTTAATLSSDNADKANGTTTYTSSDGTKYTATTYGLGLISAGLMQGWSTFMGAGNDVDVGMLKAKDDEFFFQSTDSSGNPTICREYLTSVGAATFTKVPYEKDKPISIGNGTYYVNGAETNLTLGTAINEPFRVIYEADEIHPLNHWSIPSTASLVEFFYASFGTPKGFDVLATSNQVWWVKEMFAFIGLLAIFFLIFPLVALLLTIPAFKSLKTKVSKVHNEDGTITLKETPVTLEGIKNEEPEVKSILDYILYFIPAIVCTIFSGFIIHDFVNEWGSRWFPNTQLYPQDTTNWVALWSAACGLFAVLVILIFYVVRKAINAYQKKEAPVNPFEVARIDAVSLLKTIALAFLVVIILYAITFINWAIFVTDFRIWTFTIKVFNVPEMVPTAMRYLLFFAIFYVCNGIANQSYRAKNLPEWATIAINAFFTVAGIALVIGIQYGVFKSTGVLWQSDMALGYIVLFPIIPILIIAVIISRLLYKVTGNIYLGSFINAILFTMITVSSTASSFAYVMG